jgi:predicted lipid-binding transport protein (Tim44 family)
MPGGPHRLGWAETAGYDPSRVRASRAHTRYMGRIIGTILGAILAIWLAVTAAGGIFATLKTFLIIALIAMAVFIVVWLVARGPRRG